MPNANYKIKIFQSQYRDLYPYHRAFSQGHNPVALLPGASHLMKCPVHLENDKQILEYKGVRNLPFKYREMKFSASSWMFRSAVFSHLYGPKS